MGLTNHSDVAWFSFWSAAARAADYISESGIVLSELSQYSRHVRENFRAVALKYPELTVVKSLKRAPLLPRTGNYSDFTSFYAKSPSGDAGPGVQVVAHLQRALTQFHQGIVRLRLVDGATPQEKARLEACRARNASGWLQPSPLE